MAVQPRGLEGSTPLECEIPADQSLIGLINFGGKLKETCDQNIPGYTDNINTETTAHDWDEVRKALGEEKISLLGTSYGTYLASMYATKFPNNTDKVILDSGYNVDADTTEQLRGFDEAMADFLTWVARHDATYHLGTTPEAVYARWSQRITDETGASPTITPPNATNLERVSTDLKGLWTQITSGGGNQVNSPTLLLTQVYLGIPTEWPKLAKTIASPEPTVLPESLQTFEMAPMAPIVICNDRNVPIRPTHLASGMWSQITGHPYATIHLIASGVLCAGAETKQPAPAISGEKLAIKPLQIQGTRDPNTPYWNFQDMAQAMQSHVLTVEGPGHVQGLTGNKELNKIIGEYLRTGSTTETKIAGIDPKPEP
nr:alpha/beta fold hydrolase [Corynebacterium freiburgense]